MINSLVLLLGAVLVSGLEGFLVGESSRPPLQDDSRENSQPADPVAPGKLDPAAWGGDHVGRRVPEYVTGDECLFCHRNDVGPSWASNRHATTVRTAGSEAPAVSGLTGSSGLKQAASDGELLLLGRGKRVRFLKPNGYGKLSLFKETSTPPVLASGSARRGVWDEHEFEGSCAGCHCTGVDARTVRFSATSLDCYVCHGEAKLEHTVDTRNMILSKKRADPARVVISICAQCHVRNGKSRSTGLPYPNSFVAGDNLWRDFEVDFSDRSLAALSPADRHILENVRDVVLYGKEKISCLDCHDVHKGSSEKHRRVRRQDYCWHCHENRRVKQVREPLELHNETCEY